MPQQQTRRRVLQYTGAAAVALTTGASTVGGSPSKKVRLLEATLVYESVSQGQNEVEIQYAHVCPDGFYRVDESARTIEVPESPAQDSMKDALQNNRRVVNFGGLRALPKEALGGDLPESLVDTAIGTRPTSVILLPNRNPKTDEKSESSSGPKRTPKFQISPKDGESIVKIQDTSFSVPVGETELVTLDRYDETVMGIRFGNGKMEGTGLPAQEVSQKHEQVELSLTVEPELRIKDFGDLSLEE